MFFLLLYLYFSSIKHWWLITSFDHSIFSFMKTHEMQSKTIQISQIFPCATLHVKSWLLPVSFSASRQIFLSLNSPSLQTWLVHTRIYWRLLGGRTDQWRHWWSRTRDKRQPGCPQLLSVFWTVTLRSIWASPTRPRWVICVREINAVPKISHCPATRRSWVQSLDWSRVELSL